MQKFYVDTNGVFLGGFDGSIPEGGIEVETPPIDGRQIYQNGAWCQTLECCKECKKSEIELAWQAECESGFEYAYGGSTYTFDGALRQGGNKESTLTVISCKTNKNNLKSSHTVADLTFYDKDGVGVVFATKKDFIDFGASYMDWRDALDQKRTTLKSQINACETVEAVQAITW